MFKESKRIIYILMSITFLFVIFLAGYAMKLNNKEKLKNNLGVEYQHMEDNLKSNDERETLQTRVTDNNIVSISTNINYKTKYNKCDHEAIKDEKPKQEMIGFDRKLFEDYVKLNLPDWKMSMFSKEEIFLLREKDTLCSNHLVVGEKNGKIAIFTIDENGERVVHKIFKDTTISTIREENQKRLKQGIVVDNEEEAIQVLEDFIS